MDKNGSSSCRGDEGKDITVLDVNNPIHPEIISSPIVSTASPTASPTAAALSYVNNPLLQQKQQHTLSSAATAAAMAVKDIRSKDISHCKKNITSSSSISRSSRSSNSSNSSSASSYTNHVTSFVRHIFAINKAPSSLPPHWPHSSEEDYKAMPERIISIGTPQDYTFNTNFIKTSKYEWYNFLGKYLLEEFHYKNKLANCYFLIIACCQCIPAITNTGGLPTVLIPLVCVVLCNGVLAIYEDLSRQKADALANSSVTYKYDKELNEMVPVLWSELAVGDYCLVSNREIIPADMIILCVYEKDPLLPRGVCYVETKSLDGETNLKIRNALPSTLAKVSVSQLSSLIGQINMEHPNKIPDSFTGVIRISSLQCKEAVLSQNLLLRGCVLRSTDWAIGLVVNTGKDTKIMMGNTDTKVKSSLLELTISKQILNIVTLLLVFCFVGATGQAIWNTEQSIDDVWYLHWDQVPASYWFVKFAYYLLLHSQFIPVSLYVSMSIIRLFQSYFMCNDICMYHEPTDTPAAVRTMTLNEELGQISHIFADKTGTLTCNVMAFRKASINGVAYGTGITEIGRSSAKVRGISVSDEVLNEEALAQSKAVPHVIFHCTQFDRDCKLRGGQGVKIKAFFKYVSLCHDVITEVIAQKTNANSMDRCSTLISNASDDRKLSASNPDDQALVCAAEYFGFRFDDRQGKRNSITNLETGLQEQIDVLETLDFSSDRKRMSVILKEPTDDFIRVICKGADNVMLSRLASDQDELIRTTVEHVDKYSDEGLRCLVICTKTITKTDYDVWSKKYSACRVDLKELDRFKLGLPNAISDLQDEMETNFTLLGATAIEDKLQDGVGDCIETLTNADIKVWMLTGDKEETATNIALACNLLQPTEYMDHVIINSKTCKTVTSIEAMLNRFNGSAATACSDTKAKPKGLIIDGTTLHLCANPTLRPLLVTFIHSCKSVVACRVSPAQKREIVRMVRSSSPITTRTLAIGDGANDVAMIQEAHVGVGIKGEEGVQAVNAADYSIAQFRFLTPLLFKHGRYNYIRMCNLVGYIFYKNILISAAQFWFNFYGAFSGQKIYTELAIQFYNLIFTSLPIVLYGIYDQDVPYDVVLKVPALYISTCRGDDISFYRFWGWIVSALIESTIFCILPLVFLQNSNADGSGVTFWETGAVCYTSIVCIVNLKLFFFQSHWYAASIALLCASILSWFLVAYGISCLTITDFNFYRLWQHVLSNPSFWLTVLLTCTIALVMELTILEVKKTIAEVNTTANSDVKKAHLISTVSIELHHTTGKSYGNGSNVGSDNDDNGCQQIDLDNVYAAAAQVPIKNRI